ncbi:unnamed protein product, partial [Rotaria sp. Silwood1]
KELADLISKARTIPFGVVVNGVIVVVVNDVVVVNGGVVVDGGVVVEGGNIVVTTVVAAGILFFFMP